MLQRVIICLSVALVAFSGVFLTVGGAILLSAGGSIYYLLAGLALIAVAWALAIRRHWAHPLYGLLLGGTLLWSLGEAGLDGWALVPRLIAPAVLGAVLLSPWLRRRGGGTGGWWIGVPLAGIALVFALAATRPDAPAVPLPPAGPATVAAGVDGEWTAWGRTHAGQRFSPVRQIGAGNVQRLELAWTYESNVPFHGVHSFEVTPLAANGLLYACLDRNVIVALDQDSGREVWRFDPGARLDGVFAATCRGVSYHVSPKPLAECARRILFGVADNRLMAVDALTGRPCRGFGRNGAVNLTEGLGKIPPGITFPTSPPTIVRGVVMISGWVTDGAYVGEPSGGVRGYDAITGVRRWTWDAGRADPQRPPAPGETYTKGAPNAWGVFSGDEALGMVYVPTGNSTPDYIGAHRSPYAERYATSIAALDVATGRVRWSAQLIHHDLWDYDVGAQPVLADLPGKGGTTPALIAATKTGRF